MSYTIRIGQAAIFALDGEARAMVGREEHAAAPRFDGEVQAGRSNERRSSEAATWYGFCKEVRLVDLFFAKRGLARRRPGCFLIEAEHLERVSAALSTWREAHPDAQPRFKHRHVEAHLARLIWLEWWMRYALKTHSLPAIYNF